MVNEFDWKSLLVEHLKSELQFLFNSLLRSEPEAFVQVTTFAERQSEQLLCNEYQREVFFSDQNRSDSSFFDFVQRKQKKTHNLFCNRTK